MPTRRDAQDDLKRLNDDFLDEIRDPEGRASALDAYARLKGVIKRP